VLKDEKLTKEYKLEMLIYLLEISNLNSEQLYQYSKSVTKIYQDKSLTDKLKAYERFDDPQEKSRSELIRDFELMLPKSNFTSEEAFKYLKKIKLKSIIQIIIGILFLLLGFGMIIMPAPPNFEVFTIFFITQEDGVTLMDVIALIIVFSSIFIIIGGYKNLKHT